MPASSIIRLVSSTCCFVGSSTASMRRMTHIGRMTSGYLPRLKRSRRTSSAIPQMKETILLCVAWSTLPLPLEQLRRMPLEQFPVRPQRRVLRQLDLRSVQSVVALPILELLAKPLPDLEDVVRRDRHVPLVVET